MVEQSFLPETRLELEVFLFAAMLMYKLHPFKLSDSTLRKIPNSVQEEVNVLEVLVAVVVKGGGR